VRVDVLYGGRSGRTKAIIDLLGMLFLLHAGVYRDDGAVGELRRRLLPHH
jgi:hypothetical protein